MLSEISWTQILYDPLLYMDSKTQNLPRRCRQVIGGCLRGGDMGGLAMGKGVKKYKPAAVNKSWGCKLHHGDWSW